jgi:hypothetical protein
LVVARAGGACEYCRLLQDAAGVTFHVEHIRPRTLGGQTDLSNSPWDVLAAILRRAPALKALTPTVQRENYLFLAVTILGSWDGISTSHWIAKLAES